LPDVSVRLDDKMYCPPCFATLSVQQQQQKRPEPEPQMQQQQQHQQQQQQPATKRICKKKKESDFE